MTITIEHPSGALKARITEKRHDRGTFRVVLFERGAGTCITAWERGGVQATPNWLQIWSEQYDCPLHILRDRLHDHVMASRRDVLIITL
jgi:hypothetical protein